MSINMFYNWYFIHICYAMTLKKMEFIFQKLYIPLDVPLVTIKL